MKKTINNNSVRLETHIELNGFKVQGRKRSKAVTHQQSARTAKSNSIQRNMTKLEAIESKFLRDAFKANRADKQRETRRAKRNR